MSLVTMARSHKSDLIMAGERHLLDRWSDLPRLSRGVLSGEYILEQNGQPIARAQKPSAFLSAFVVEYQDRNYTLKKNP